MKTQNISNQSFQASFKLGEFGYGKERFYKAAENHPEDTKQLTEFTEFVNSKEGRSLLKRLPEEDVVELKLPITYLGSGRSEKISPELYYKKNGCSPEKLKIGVSKESFREWICEQAAKQSKMLENLFTGFTVNPHE